MHYAQQYARHEWDHLDRELVGTIEKAVGGLHARRVLDLGGGPGQFSVEFARRGARVVWHDVSRNYRAIATEQAQTAGVEVEFSLGYLEDARKFLSVPFDLVFCRLCWYYCMDDRAFARLVYRLIIPGGAGYVESMTSETEKRAGWRRIPSLLNHRLWIKVGHPFPPPSRIEWLFRSLGGDPIAVDHSPVADDRILFHKPR